MGRTAKIGLEYFPFDVHFFEDIKIRKLIKYQSSKALAVYINLLCRIYTNGYYLGWDDDMPFVISEQTGYDEVFIQEVIKCCFMVGLFDTEMFEKEKILTSESIQSRYLTICKNSKRVTGVDMFSLLPFPQNNSEDKPISSEDIQINSGEIPQSKEKKSIEKETISKDIVKKKSGDETEDKSSKTDMTIPLEERRKAFYDSLIPYLTTQGGEYEPELVRKFYNHWSQVNEGGKKMLWEKERDKKCFQLSSRLSTFKSNEKKWALEKAQRYEENKGKVFAKGISIVDAIGTAMMNGTSGGGVNGMLKGEGQQELLSIEEQ